MNYATRFLKVFSFAGLLLFAINCGGNGAVPDGSSVSVGGQGPGSGVPDGGTPPTADAGPPPPDGAVASNCSDLFDDSQVTTYSIEISADQWAAMEAEFQNITALLAGENFAVYHPITFHYGNETVTDAEIKLHGQSSWVQTVQDDGANAKMQFNISFDQQNPSGKFHGVSKITFDMPRADWTFLNNRVAQHWLRQVGILAPCSSSARLNINGAYYGLYVLEDNVGGQIVQEFFPQNPDGDLWKGASEIETNQTDPNYGRLMQFTGATDLSSLTAIMDIPNSLNSWAAEAMLNDADGYYGGLHNFYIYDQGAAGFVFLPEDTDSLLEWMYLFDRVDATDHPIYWWFDRDQPAPNPGDKWLLVLNDPTWRARYTQALSTMISKWDVTQIQGWITTWSQQIADSVATDPHAWATPADFQMAIADDLDVVAKRPVYLQTFIDCENGVPGQATDGDGDGYKWCDECDDKNASVHPGAPEICGNGIDDNCNGFVDEGCPAAVPDAGGVNADGGVTGH
jgi:hypothetical protein